MAGQEIEGDLWDQSLGLDLLPTIVCAGFRTLSFASVLNLGSRKPRLNEISSRSSINPTQVDTCIKKDVTQDLIKLSLGWDTRAV